MATEVGAWKYLGREKTRTLSMATLAGTMSKSLQLQMARFQERNPSCESVVPVSMEMAAMMKEDIQSTFFWWSRSHRRTGCRREEK